MSPPQFKVAILGAGPAGLLLSNILLKRCPQASLSLSIFEKESSASSRGHQGGTLDLHGPTGQYAVREAGLWDGFQKYARYDAAGMTILSDQAEVLIQMGGSKFDKSGGKPEIDRAHLRTVLLEGVEAAGGRVNWGRNVRQVDEERLVHFSLGEQEVEEVEGPFDLIVGAEGGWSKVRPLLSDVKPFHAGVNGIELNIPNAAARFPEIGARIGEGSCMAFGYKQQLGGQAQTNKSIRIHTWRAQSESDFATLQQMSKDPVAAKHHLLEEYKDWSPELKHWIEVADEDHMRPWSLYMLPVGFSWPHKPGFTLIGDAAHLMTPLGGFGANTALYDAAVLGIKISEAIAAGAVDLSPAVQAYEVEVQPQAEKVMAQTDMNREQLFLKGKTLEELKQMLEFALKKAEKMLDEKA